MIQSLLDKLNLPPVLAPDLDKTQWNKRREEMIATFSQNVYGESPAAPAQVRADVTKEERRAWAGKADRLEVALSFDTQGGSFTFPVDFVLPINAGDSLPLILYISFEKYPNGRYGPIEEIVDNGFALATFCYKDVTSDDGDLANGLMGEFPKTEGDGAYWGKIGAWAYAASRVMDYALTLDTIDPSRIACMGHSRLGKTSLWCGAQDERFSAVVSNNSGCCGAAISRGKRGETVGRIGDVFPYWFCENFRAFKEREFEMPFDQHQLIAAIAPRRVYVASAEEDIWADPQSEYLSAAAASPAYRLFGLDGLVCPNRLPVAGDAFHEGEIGYHLRAGTHFMSRYDWGAVMRYLKKHQRK